MVPLLLVLLLKHFMEIIGHHALVGSDGVEGRPSQFPSGHNPKALTRSHSQDVGAGTASHTLAWPSSYPFPRVFLRRIRHHMVALLLLCLSLQVCCSKLTVGKAREHPVWEQGLRVRLPGPALVPALLVRPLANAFHLF